MDEEIYGYGENGLVVVGRIVDLGNSVAVKKTTVDLTPEWFKNCQRIHELEKSVDSLKESNDMLGQKVGELAGRVLELETLLEHSGKYLQVAYDKLAQCEEMLIALNEAPKEKATAVINLTFPEGQTDRIIEEMRKIVLKEVVRR